ncbi:hypothetical protein U91I_01779 [alpha proteobacterium U9-1i]|nr:hypothetical protein U91I_01779 [alpha proteobacterium U9-1i]
MLGAEGSMKVLSALAALVLAASCATPLVPTGRSALTHQIADDAAAFNEAYGQAVSAQILLNILRSRDRLPRHYLSMTGISDSPSLRWRENAGVGSIPLGEGSSPWGFGSLGIERETQSRPTYAVQPFAADTLTRAAFQPTQPYVFAHYWRSGWPRDLLTLMMVERITLHTADGQSHTFNNEANEIFENCAPSIQTHGCEFVRALRTFLDRVDHPAELSTAANARGVCGLVEAYLPARPVRATPPAEGQDCDPVFAVGPDFYTFRLRSLDDMIYFVGELMRAGAMRAAPGEPIDAQVSISAAGLRGGGQGVPLFRIVPHASVQQRGYAARVSYAGALYFAGPAVGRSCSEASQEGVCMDTAEEGDRSSSVLSLIAEIMALNQSPDAIRPPSRLIAE